MTVKNAEKGVIFGTKIHNPGILKQNPFTDSWKEIRKMR